MSKSMLEIVGLMITGGVLQAAFNYFLEKRKNKRVDFETILGRLEKENNELRQDENHYNARLRELENKVLNMHYKIQLLSNAQLDLPLPMWFKDVDGTMLSLNHAYEELLLKPLDKSGMDYIGNSDESIWGEELATRIRTFDQQVIHNDKTLDYEMRIPILGQDFKIRIIKYPRMAGGAKLGIVGIAIPPASLSV